MLGAADERANAGDQLVVFIRHRVTDRIRNVQRGRTGLERRPKHVEEKRAIGACRVLGRKLHVVAEAARVRDHSRHESQHLGVRLP